MFDLEFSNCEKKCRKENFTVLSQSLNIGIKTLISALNSVLKVLQLWSKATATPL